MVMKVVVLRYPRALARAAWKRPFSPSRRALVRVEVQVARMMRKLFAWVVSVAVLHSGPSTASEWTAYDAVRFDINMPKDSPVVHQERACTSAIWYTP